MKIKKSFLLPLLLTCLSTTSFSQILPPDFFGIYYAIYPDSMPLTLLPVSGGKNVVAHFKSSDGRNNNGTLEVEYLNGLGQLRQRIAVGSGGQQQDLVSYYEHDALGRDWRSWLPAPIMGEGGAFQAKDAVTLASKSSHGQDDAPYSFPVYETSALGRVVERYGPGEDWHNGGKSQKIEYLSNNAVNGSERACRRFTFHYGTDNSLATVSASGLYAAGTLQVTKYVNEDKEELLTFHDRQGRLVLSRALMGYGEASLDTYFLYDGWGNLCIVLPPALSAEVSANGILSSTLISNYAYVYKYDPLNRMVAKKLPGADAILMAYDNADRLIFSQDGVQQQEGKATFHIYDTFGRECLTGVCVADGNTMSSIEGYAHCSYTGQGSMMGYNVTGITLNNPVVTSANYYDNYDFISDDSLRYVDDAYALLRPLTHKGLHTGTSHLILSTDTTLCYLHQTFFYDEHNRIIQQHATNHLDGYDHDYMEYDFSGNVLAKHHFHRSKYKSLAEEYTYTYDHANRLLTATHRVNGKPTVKIVDNTYDALGRLTSNSRNGNAALKTDYGYNVRSWVNSISSHLFTETIHHHTQAGVAGCTPLFSGKVSAISWLSGDTVSRGYQFHYDQASRLVLADYTENGASSDKFQTAYTYDANGNLMTLQRNGYYLKSYLTFDNLDFSYTGNQLKAVSKTGASPKYYGAMYFHDGSDTDVEYEYDKNGNIVKDLNKKISSVEYNLLNLPQKITKEVFVWPQGHMKTMLYGWRA